MGRPTWTENVNFLETPNMESYTYSSDCNNTEMYSSNFEERIPNSFYNPNTFETYIPEDGEQISSGSPNHNHTNALYTQNSPIIEMSSYDGNISKLKVLTPNELSINAANELAALEMKGGLTAVEAPDFERNNNLHWHYKQISKEVDWEAEHMENTFQWEHGGVKQEPMLSYDQFEESTPRHWPQQSKFEYAELKSSSKYVMEEFVPASQNQPIMNNVALEYEPTMTYTIIQNPSAVEQGRHHQDVHHYNNVGQFVSDYISEDPLLESYQQKNDFVLRPKMTEKRSLSAWQKKQAKSAGICVVCSDKSSGWHYNVQVMKDFLMKRE